jgi:hypothetical protein
MFMNMEQDIREKLIFSLNAVATHQVARSPQKSTHHFGTKWKKDKVGAKLLVAATLALRAWYRMEVIKRKPELIVQSTEDVMQVYGGSKLERKLDGKLNLTSTENRFHSASFEPIAFVSKALAELARQSIRKEHHEKAKQLIAAQDQPSEVVEIMQRTLDLADRIVAQKMDVNWWRRKGTLKEDTRILGRLMWDSGLLDRKTLGLSIRVGGFKASIATYNRCVANFTELTARVKEAPHMAPLLLNRETGFVATHQTVWKDLKETFKSLGGTNQAWRWFNSQGHAWHAHFTMSRDEIGVINALAATQVGKAPYHRGLVNSLRAQFNAGEPSQNISMYIEVFKAAVTAYKRRKLKVSEFQDYILIFDYLRRAPNATSRGATWASLMRRQRAWHLEDARQNMENRKKSGVRYSWAPIVSQLQAGDLEAISLNTSEELWEEGILQRHCVGGYDHNCYLNESRIYSIRRDGDRMATLEVSLRGDKFENRQLYGPGNSKVTDKSVQALAKKILSTCRRAPKLTVADNKKIVVATALPAKSRYEEEALPY